MTVKLETHGTPSGRQVHRFIIQTETTAQALRRKLLDIGADATLEGSTFDNETGEIVLYFVEGE